jgi:hypothetical protein
MPKPAKSQRPSYSKDGCASAPPPLSSTPGHCPLLRQTTLGQPFTRVLSAGGGTSLPSRGSTSGPLVPQRPRSSVAVGVSYWVILTFSRNCIRRHLRFRSSAANPGSSKAAFKRTELAAPFPPLQAGRWCFQHSVFQASGQRSIPREDAHYPQALASRKPNRRSATRHVPCGGTKGKAARRTVRPCQKLSADYFRRKIIKPSAPKPSNASVPGSGM